ncbi:MAG: ROK family protein [Chitinophagaceae bacterium]|nr:ROK family protein [Chitinophagaceae bacterium]
MGLVSKKTDLYRKEIFKTLYFEKAASCADISAKIGKSIPLITKVLNDLIKEGVVIETGYASSTGGRRALLYSLKEDTINIVAVAVEQYVTRIAIMNFKNELVGSVYEMDLHLQKNDDSLNIITAKIEEIITASGIDKTKIAGIGIGMPGFINVNDGINYSYLQTGTKENIPTYMSNKLGLPVYIDNDSTLMGLAELKFGSLYGKKNAMVINIGWGIGLGVILNGQVYRGMNGFAGEFSHIPLFASDRLCTCGKSGCLDTEAPLAVILERALEGLKDGQLSKLKEKELKGRPEDAVDALIEAAKTGDMFTVKLFSESAYSIGRGIAVLIHLLNPEIFILTGRGAALGKIWLAPMYHSLNEHCIPSLSVNTQLKISSLGIDAELIGAAALVMENYAEDHLLKSHTN